MDMGKIGVMSKRSSSYVDRLSPLSPHFSSAALGELGEGWFCPLQAVGAGTLTCVFSGPCAAEGEAPNVHLPLLEYM